MQRALAIVFLLIVLPLILATGVLAATDDAPAHLTQAQATKDARTFLSLLEATHPDPYSNLGGKIEFKRTAEKLVRDIPADGLSVPDFIERLSAFLAPLKDGHTRVRGGRSRWQDPAPRLAVVFGIASDGLLIESSDLAELKGARGYKLVAVDGHPIPELLNRMSMQAATENDYGSYVGLTMALRSYKLLQNLIPDLDRAHGVATKWNATSVGKANIQRIRRNGLTNRRRGPVWNTPISRSTTASFPMDTLHIFALRL